MSTSTTERNADSPSVDSHRNGPMSNAERQRRYRDHQRGGPAVGRWHGHVPAERTAAGWGISRAMLFMASFVLDHAPELEAEIMAGTLRLTRAYKLVRRQHDMAVVKMARQRLAGDQGDGGPGE